MAETIANVTAAKPKVGGAMWVAPMGTKLPTDATSALDSAFKGLGYVSEDGMVNSNTPKSDNIKSWGGKVVYTYQSDRPDTFQLTFIESLNVDVLKLIYGEDNVTVDSETGNITVKATASELGEHEYVCDMIMRNGKLKRIVIPDGKISDLGDITYKDDELSGYESTITALPDSDGVTHYEYISGK